jgi:hypothetical protein
MSEYDNTNTAISFVDQGLFSAEGEKAKCRAPILTVKVNVDGVEKEIGLWFATDKETGKYRLTKNGSKMLTGQVKAPYQTDSQPSQTTTPVANVNAPQDGFDDEIPF